MENFMKIDWMNLEMFELIKFILFLSFIIFGSKVNRRIASLIQDNFNEIKLGHKWSVFSLVKNYFIGFSGSSVIVFMAHGLAGVTLKMDLLFLVMTFGVWTYYLVTNNKEGDQDGIEQRKKSFF